MAGSGMGIDPAVLSLQIAGGQVSTAEHYETVDPASGQVLVRAARGSADHVDAAVAAAAAAQRDWRRSSPEQRSRLLVRTAELIRAERAELAGLESADTGKPLRQAYADVDVCARYFEFYGHVIEAHHGRTIPVDSAFHAYTVREPYGVTGHIVAWNYPLQLIGRALASSLATGNCAVVKPAEQTPRTALRLAQLIDRAGFPAGACSVITGLGAEAGTAVAQHPGISHLGFVGSTHTGSLIAHAAADRVIPAVLELGGKSANIVFPDADLDDALPQVVRSIIQNAGQTCSAGSRLLVQRSIHSQLVERLVDALSTVSVGRGADDPDLGPLISHTQLQRVEGFLRRCDSGELVLGGGAPSELPADVAGGSFFAPTVVDGVDPAAEIAQEEVFGPVVVVTAFDDEEEAIALANGTAYGLISAAWTADLGRAHRMAAEIEAGQVFINTYGAGGGVELPFGGMKRSGYGREKSIEALDEYTRTKTVVMRG